MYTRVDAIAIATEDGRILLLHQDTDGPALALIKGKIEARGPW